MSTDAFAAALARGACMSRPRLSQALGIGILFGVVEATTPLIGWLLGSAASRFVASIDHWVVEMKKLAHPVKITENWIKTEVPEMHD